MNIENIIDSVMQFYSWIYSQTGLQDWQLLTIGLGILFLLVLSLIQQRKTRSRKVYVIQGSNRSDIIGANLSDREKHYHRHENFSKKPPVSASDEEEEGKSWGQSTKEWRRLSEKIRHLQHEIGKQERSEKHLKEQITELKSINDKLQSEISRKTQIEEELKQQLQELTTASPANVQEKSAEKTNVNSRGRELKNIKETLESAKFMLKKDQTKQAVAGTESQKEPLESQQITNKTDCVPLEIAVNQLQSQTVGNKANSLEGNIDEADTERDHNIPLDIKELKAIADLAKRLQMRSQQRQSE